MVSFRIKGQYNQDNLNSKKVNQGQNYFGDKNYNISWYRDRNIDQNDDWRIEDDYKNKSGLYVPLRN